MYESILSCGPNDYYQECITTLAIICTIDTHYVGDLPAVPHLGEHGAQALLVQTRELVQTQESSAHCKWSNIPIIMTLQAKECLHVLCMVLL